MGEWSDYFEDFPEENPANWVKENPVNGVFATIIREQEKGKLRLKKNAELNTMIAKAKRETKARSLLVVENCPQCGLKELNTYKITESFYLCECQECGIYGNGKTHEQALARTQDALGEGLDWRAR